MNCGSLNCLLLVYDKLHEINGDFLFTLRYWLFSQSNLYKYDTSAVSNIWQFTKTPPEFFLKWCVCARWWREFKTSKEKNKRNTKSDEIKKKNLQEVKKTEVMSEDNCLLLTNAACRVLTERKKPTLSPFFPIPVLILFLQTMVIHLFCNFSVPYREVKSEFMIVSVAPNAIATTNL